MGDITLPLGVVLGAISTVFLGMSGIIAWLAKEVRAERRARRGDKRRYAYGMKSARFVIERTDGVPSAPPPALTEWKDDSAIIEAEALENERWMERKKAGLDASERTPEQVFLHPRKTPPRR